MNQGERWATYISTILQRRRRFPGDTLAITLNAGDNSRKGLNTMQRVALLAAGLLIAAVIAPIDRAGAIAFFCNGQEATGFLIKPGTLIGTNGDDVLVGSTGADTIKGLGGDDLICGDPEPQNAAGGDDAISGGTGADVIRDDRGFNSVSGDAGNDDVRGVGIVRGGTGNDDLGVTQPGSIADGGAGHDVVGAGQRRHSQGRLRE